MRQWLALLGLRLRLLIRTGGRRRGTFVLSAVIMTVFSAWMGSGLYLQLTRASAAHAAETVHVFLVGLSVFWATSPLLGYPFSEFHDVSKIFVYPIGHRRAFLATTTAGMVSLSMIFLGGLATALLAGLPGPVPVRVVRGLLLALFFLHAAAVAQMLHLFFLSLFSRRQLRDAAMLLAPILSIAVYLAFRWTVIGGTDGGPDLTELRPSRYLWLFPARWLSQLLVDPTGGAWWTWPVLLGGFVAATTVVVGLGARFQEQAFYGEVTDTRRRRPASRRQPGRLQRLVARTVEALVPPATLAVALKEWRQLWRDPILTNQFLRQTTLFILPFVFPFFEGPPGQADMIGHLYGMLVGFLILSQSPMVGNLFGTDASAVVELLVRGQDRRHVFLGKNLCHLFLYLVLDALVLGAFGLVFGLEHLFAGFFVAAVGATFLSVAAGNISSVYLSTPLARPGQRAIEQQAERREGCSTMILRMLSGIVSLGLTFPLALLVWVAFSVGGPLALAGLIAAAVYSIGGWILSIQAAADLLGEREEDLIRQMTG